tara:strand:- start:418 stop:678 length:261 start_codon:yes stop_codon:yes gene_type:complete
MKHSTEVGRSSHILSTNPVEYLMESSSTSSWESTKSLRLSSGLGIGREALITSSTRELVEFYWTNRKRFSGSYLGFPSKICSDQEK